MFSFPPSPVDEIRSLNAAPGAPGASTSDEPSSWESCFFGAAFHTWNNSVGSQLDSEDTAPSEPLATLERFSNFALPLHLAERRSGHSEQGNQFDGDLWVPGDFGRIVRLTCPYPSLTLSQGSGSDSSDKASQRIREDLCFIAIYLGDRSSRDSVRLCGSLARALAVINEGNPLQPHTSAPLINLVARWVRREVPTQLCQQMLHHVSSDETPHLAALRLDLFMSMLDQLPERLSELLPEQTSDSPKFLRNLWHVACSHDKCEALLGASRFAKVLTLYEMPTLLAKMRSDNPKSLRAYVTLLRDASRVLTSRAGSGSMSQDSPESLALLDSAIVNLLSSVQGSHHEASNQAVNRYDTRDLRPALLLLKSATEIVTKHDRSSAEDRTWCLALLGSGISEREVMFQLSLSLELGIPLSKLFCALDVARSRLPQARPTASVETAVTPQGTKATASVRSFRYFRNLQPIQPARQVSPTPSYTITPLEVLALRLNKSCPGWQNSADDITNRFLALVDEDSIDGYKLSSDFALLAGVCSQTRSGDQISRYGGTLLNWAASKTPLSELVSLARGLIESDFSRDLSVVSNPTERGRRAIVTSRFLGAIVNLKKLDLPIWQNADVLMDICCLPSGQQMECNRLMAMAINAIKEGATLLSGPELPGQLVKSALPIRTKESVFELNILLSAILRLKFVPALEIHRFTPIASILSATAAHLQVTAEIPDLIVESCLGEVTDLLDLGPRLEETKQHVLHWLTAPAVTSYITSTDPRIRSLAENEIAATHNTDGSWPPRGVQAAANHVQTPRQVQDDVVYVWRRAAYATSLREEKFPSRRATPSEQSHYTGFGLQAALSSAPIKLAPAPAVPYPGPGVICEGMNLDRILPRTPRGESNLAHYRKAWPWAARALPDSADAVYLHTQAFDAVIPPRGDSAGGRYTLFDADSHPVAHYSLLALSDVRWNPAELGAYLVPTDRLTAIWKRNKSEGGNTRSFSTTDSWRDSTHLLRFLRSGPAPVINLSDCCALSGFHKSLPPHFFPFEERFTGGARRRDSSGHLLLQSLPRDEYDRILTEFKFDTQRVHESIRDLAHRCFDLLSVETLYRMMWNKGATQIQLDTPWPFISHISGVYPSAFMMLNACYQWHQLRGGGDVPRDAFPIFTIGNTFERRARLKSMPIIDTYTMKLYSNGKVYQLRRDADAGEACEQALWYEHVHLKGHKIDLLDYRLCDAHGFEFAT